MLFQVAAVLLLGLWMYSQCGNLALILKEKKGKVIEPFKNSCQKSVGKLVVMEVLKFLSFVNYLCDS